MREDNDHLKDFVNKHREEFDASEPPKFDFSNLMVETVSPEVKEIKMIPITWLYRAAAIFVVIIGGALLWFLSSIQNNEPQEVANNQTIETNQSVDFSLSELSPEMAELEDYYTYELSSKQKELEELGYGDALKEEMEILDQEFVALKSELGDNVDNHLIVNEMVKNYKLKLDLLESVLHDLQENYDDKSLTKLDENEEIYTVYY